MCEMNELMKRSQKAKMYAIISLCLKIAVVVFGIMCKLLLAVLGFLSYIPLFALVTIVLLVPILLFIGLLWVAFFAYIVFAVIAIVQAIMIIQDGKATEEGVLPKDIRDNVTFAWVSSAIVLVLLLVQ